MMRLQQVLRKDNLNEYGLEFKPIKGSRPGRKNHEVIDQNRISSNLQSLHIYLKSSDIKCCKLSVNRITKVQSLKEIIYKRLSIPIYNQIIHLNGKQITLYSSIVLQEKQILHILDKTNIVGQNQSIQVNLKISAAFQANSNHKTFAFQLKGGQTADKLIQLVKQQISWQPSQNSQISFNFLESGRILNMLQTFKENKVAKKCSILCLMSQNQVQTKFTKEYQETPQQRRLNYRRIEPAHQPFSRSYQEVKKQQSSNTSNFRKNLVGNPISSGRFHVNSKTQPLQSRIQNKPNSETNQQTRQIMKGKSQTASHSPSPSGFKKKKSSSHQNQSQNSQLVTKILVHKSKQEIEQILSQNSLLVQDVEQEEQNQSIVSSSSEDQKQYLPIKQQQKQYIPVKQQKQYRPCPLIPQRKMAQSEKLKIKLQLQKLFGLEPKSNTSQDINDAQRNQNNQISTNLVADETTRSRVLVRNSNLRGSISEKQSIMPSLKDKKSNRYSEQKMNENQ